MTLFLNPQARKEAEQSKDISELREQVSALSGQIKDMGGLLAQFLNGKSASKKED